MTGRESLIEARCPECWETPDSATWYRHRLCGRKPTYAKNRRMRTLSVRWLVAQCGVNEDGTVWVTWRFRRG